MTTPNTAAKVIIIRTRIETGVATGRLLLNWYIRDPFTFSLTVLACCFPRQNMAVQVRSWGPSPPAAVKVIVEVVSQMPCGVQVCVTSVVSSWTLHENTGGCEEHVCVTEHETVIVEPASTSAGTGVITGLSGEAFITIKTQLLLNLYPSFPLSAWKQKGPLSKGLMSSISSEQFPSCRCPNSLVRSLKWSSTLLLPL